MYSAKTLDIQYKNTVHAFALLYIRKKSTNQLLKKKVYIEQTKSTIIFTHSLNKYYNIFTKHLFLVVVGYSFIFYYFILTYKKGIKPIFVLTFLHDSHFGP